eukprot:CAMPEP_0119155264 /NCGR_PEP_ID=MMETSP1310-20130426/51658_1 /TAXON_ID=464262 /ORGANISM="Genus nov. species nov., Strain RCC2339" /LENGTH=288 /DNA_ID=CAMNT_0007147855 /DNA_START=646 /DNA_END=1512 /DNA_ORIENTATION=+
MANSDKGGANQPPPLDKDVENALEASIRGVYMAFPCPFQTTVDTFAPRLKESTRFKLLVTSLGGTDADTFLALNREHVKRLSKNVKQSMKNSLLQVDKTGDAAPSLRHKWRKGALRRLVKTSGVCYEPGQERDGKDPVLVKLLLFRRSFRSLPGPANGKGSEMYTNAIRDADNSMAALFSMAAHDMDDYITDLLEEEVQFDTQNSDHDDINEPARRFIDNVQASNLHSVAARALQSLPGPGRNADSRVPQLLPGPDQNADSWVPQSLPLRGRNADSRVFRRPHIIRNP